MASKRRRRTYEDAPPDAPEPEIEVDDADPEPAVPDDPEVQEVYWTAQSVKADLDKARAATQAAYATLEAAHTARIAALDQEIADRQHALAGVRTGLRAQEVRLETARARISALLKELAHGE